MSSSTQSKDLPVTPTDESNNTSSSKTYKNTRRQSYQDIFMTRSLDPIIEDSCPKIAVKVKHAVKSYRSESPVLNKLNMTVHKGTIYSLLGSSGCGKTTLLSCIAGLRNLSEGEISVFGSKPGSKGSGIPGKRIGYMPQDVALYGNFNISETLQYFGTLNDMKSAEINAAQDFLIDFLGLPTENRRICTLSGGQKRRVSLAVALIHSPELLILDEPTVGVDPILRESIWNHLRKLVSYQATTVIISTHYIEEAKQSDTVGIMRGGRLIAEKNTKMLLAEYNTTVLEDIVLPLCQKDIANPDCCDLQENYIHEKSFDDKQTPELTSDEQEVNNLYESSNSINILKALILKNFITMSRNPLLVGFILLMPVVLGFVVFTAIGGNAKGLSFAVVNHETNCSDYDPLKYGYEECDLENLSCKFLSMLPTEIIQMETFKTNELAREAVKVGKVWGFLSIPEGYSDNVYARATSGNAIDNETLEGSNLIFEMDQSNANIAVTLKNEFYNGFKEFIKKLMLDCGFYPELGDVPLNFETTIYGTDNTDFAEFVAPSLCLSVIFFFPLCSTSVSIILDRKNGTLERTLVASVRNWQIMMALIISEGLILCIQSVITIITMVVIFNLTIQGSVSLTMCLFILIGLSGVLMGFLMGPLCNEEIEAALLSLGFFCPAVILSGTIWPIEAQPLYLQYFSYLLPTTFSSEALRSIISRGWTLSHKSVWLGFATPLAWVGFVWIFNILIHKISSARK